MEKDKELLIEAYFANTLTSRQQQQLEWLLLNDETFSEALNFEKEIRETIVFNERQKLKERFRTLDMQDARPVRKLAGWWYAAASVVVLVGLTWFFSSKPSQMTTERLYAQYMETYPNMVTPLVRGHIPQDELMAEAMMLYDKQAYSESAVLLQQVYDEQPNHQAAFYLAICQLMLENPSEAIALLEMKDWRESAYFSPSVVDWYLGLAYLKTGDERQAIPLFKRVVASDNRLSEEANRIVKALENG